jgi:hypothetical protein
VVMSNKNGFYGMEHELGCPCACHWTKWATPDECRPCGGTGRVTLGRLVELDRVRRRKAIPRHVRCFVVDMGHAEVEEAVMGSEPDDRRPDVDGEQVIVDPRVVPKGFTDLTPEQIQADMKLYFEWLKRDGHAESKLQGWN